MSMSRKKNMQPQDGDGLRASGCADCGCNDLAWASINKGVLLCEQCASVHRSLGRHISQVKSLRKGLWHPSQLNMVRELHAVSAGNSIWEHTLLDPGLAATISMKMSRSNTRKPSPKDPIHPNKEDFIRAKYLSLAFVNKSSDDSDLSEQLHTTVRSAGLKTSLRLLAAGADPNYVHPEKGTSAIHVAANSGQLLQIELLLVYGADPRQPDTKGKQAIDYAKANNMKEIVERLVSAQYEVTDRLTRFVCGKIAEHEYGQHFLVPEMRESPDMVNLSRAARSGLQALPNRVFEELAKDVYDEVDRRETEDIVASMQPQISAISPVPFLPVNPNYSRIRNQGRQKLARYNTREISTLIVDIITEARRRQLGLQLGISHCVEATPKKSTPAHHHGGGGLSANLRQHLNDSDSDPLYDEVPSTSSEEDTISYAKQLEAKKSNGNIKSPKTSGIASVAATDSSLQNVDLIQELVCSNKDMRQEINRLQSMVQKLIDENYQLRSFVVPRNEPPVAVCNHQQQHSSSKVPQQQQPNISASSSLPRQPAPAVINRPQSMFERQIGAPPLPPREDSGLGTLSSHHFNHDGSGNDYSSLPHQSEMTMSVRIDDGDSPGYEVEQDEPPSALPSKEEVFKRTEQITKRIQELLALAQEGKQEAYLPCAEKIGRAVDSMISVFPLTIHSHRAGSNEEQIYLALSHLRTSAVRLHQECTSAGSRAGSATNSPARVLGSPFRSEASRHLTQSVIQSAYDIAKNAKTLVTMFQ